MLIGLSHIVRSSFNQIVMNPRRSKNDDRQSGSFVYRTQSGLMFELQPNEYVDRFIAVEGIYERRFLSYLHSVLKPHSVMLDIGANIGNHAIYLAGKCSDIHCFEPNPHVANRLRHNISLNSLAHKISVHEFGLGSEDQMLPFLENVDGNLGASYFAQSDEIPAGHEVKHLQVRQALQAVAELNLDRIDYIKIDVEGMEEAVLTALQPIIAQHRPLVTFEHHEQRVAQGTFGRICKAFDGYKMMNPTFAPSEGSVTQKLFWNLRHDGGPILTEITAPERRTYENILAMPL